MYQGYSDELEYKANLKEQFREMVTSCPILYKYVNIETGIKALTHSTIGITKPTAFNDPFDCSLKLIDFENLPTDYREYLINKYQSELSEKDKKNLLVTMRQHPDELVTKKLSLLGMQMEIKNRGVSCFSRNCNNILMWAHYTKNHSGICIGFKFRPLYLTLKKLSQEIMIIPVSYKRKLTPVNYWSFKWQAIIGWLTTKAKIWEYEEEIRVILNHLNFNGESNLIVPLPKDCFNSITLGANITKEHENTLIKHLQIEYPHVEIFKIKPDEEIFEFTTERIK